MVREVGLFRLHETGSGESGHVGILRGFGLHELRDRESATGYLGHHALIPKEGGSVRGKARRLQRVAATLIGEAVHSYLETIRHAMNRAMKSDNGSVARVPLILAPRDRSCPKVSSVDGGYEENDAEIG